MLQHVVRSTVIDAPIERVWAVLRDFNSHDQLARRRRRASRIEGDERSDQVGCVRSFTLKDGNRIREQLLTLSDTEHKSTYCIVEATVPLQRYVATRDAEAGDRRRPHLLALGVDLRHAARAWSASCATWWRRASTRPASRTCAATCATAATGAAPAARRCRRPCRCPRAASSSATTAAPTCCSRGDGEAAAPARRRGAHPPARDRRQLHRRVPATRLDPGRCCRCPACRAWRPRARVLDVGAGVSGLLPGDRVAYLGPRARRLLQRAQRAGRLGGAPAAGGRGRRRPPRLLLKGITADYLLRDLGRVRARHAAAGARGGRRRRPARVRLGAPARRHRDRHGVERGQGARRARVRLRACRSSRATIASPTRCSALAAAPTW